MGDHQTPAASKEENQATGLDKARNFRWHLVLTQEWLQLGRPAKEPASLLHSILALQAVARRRSTREYQSYVARSSAGTG
jgi:hypothetical protein